MVFTTGDNNFSTAIWLVDPIAGKGTHTTIVAALAAASDGDTVFIKANAAPYIENVTFKAGVNVCAFGSDGMASSQRTPIASNVIIKGTCTASYTGTVTVSGIMFETNGAPAISVTGSNSGVLTFQDCTIYAVDATGMTFNNPNYSANFMTCLFRSESTSALFEETNLNGIDFEHCVFNMGVNSSPSTMAVSRAVFIACDMAGMYFTTSGTGGIFILGGYLQHGAQTLLTSTGTGTSEFYSMYLLSGASSAINVGAGCFVNISNCVVLSSNTNAITGSGTLRYGSLSFSNSSTINVTTQVPWYSVASQSFTPVLKFGGATTGITYATQIGSYSVVGNMIHYYVNIQLSSKGSATGTATIDGPSLATSLNNQVNDVPYFSNVTLTANYTSVLAFNTSTVWTLTQVGSAQVAAFINDTHLANNSALIFRGSYSIS